MVWSSIRYLNKDNTGVKKTFMDFIAAFCATVSSSLMNYVRNFQQKTPIGDTQMSIYQSIHELQTDVSKHEGSKIRYIQRRLCLTAGVSRVSLGMAMNAQLFDIYRQSLNKL